MKTSSILSVLALVLPFASSTPTHNKRHHEISKRVRADVDVHKRLFTSARFTYYDVGLGACGIWNQPSDKIVALNVEQFGPGYPGEYCFAPITISYGGITVEAIITDKCMGCQWGALDFSSGLFETFSPLATGVLYGEWWFNN